MRSIDVREFRRDVHRCLRLVASGETVRVTDAGRPVALLVPPPGGGGYDALLASGRIRPGTGRISDLGPPLPASAGRPPLSAVLDDLRRDER
jgi:antitoxin (DNA-binding transcriptional repressor) of toxin-antitoxin stability system